MSRRATSLVEPVGIGLIGAGRIGTSHAGLLARHVPGAQLVAVADPRPGAAEGLAAELGCQAVTDPADLFADPRVEAVVVTASSEAHAELVVAAAAAGKAVFCEKPMGLTLEEIDRGTAAAAAAGVALQVGFNRRFAADFAAGHRLVADGGVGTPQLMRSVTRDPGLANPAGVPPGRSSSRPSSMTSTPCCWLNPGAEPLSVYATADALVAPEYRDSGLLDTAVVVVTFDNGAIAVAEASFSAVYGYDVRGEVFGSAGMVSMGDGARSSLSHFTSTGRHVDTVRGDVELFRDSYIAEFVEFTDAVRAGRTPTVTGQDARRALVLALSAIESVKTGAPVPVEKVDVR